MFQIGDLVQCLNLDNPKFIGVGKVVDLSEVDNRLEVGFFYSPLNPEAEKQWVTASEVIKYEIYDEHVVYCINEESGYWQRARYGGSRPNDKHLITWRSKEDSIVDIDQIYIQNSQDDKFPSAKDFLISRCTDTPHFYEWRQSFIDAYTQQRAMARSIGAISSSSIELEPHQLSVVRQVLMDDKKKYLLGDEVGLGKTIEACLILQEFVSSHTSQIQALIVMPESLKKQWDMEIRNRFYMGHLIDDQIHLVTYEDYDANYMQFAPDIIIIDEAHQISSWAWDEEKSSVFNGVVEHFKQSEIGLLLSGTPLVGNEKNFLSMLHVLSPDEYQLTQDGIQSFESLVRDRERYGGLYQALIPSNNNANIESQLNALKSEENDFVLQNLISELLPMVDFFADEDSDERSEAILRLRKYIGENYKIHHRLIRNRRLDPDIEMLFPGFDQSGVVKIDYEVDPSVGSIEQYLDDFLLEINFEEHDCNPELECLLGLAMTLDISKNDYEWFSEAFPKLSRFDGFEAFVNFYIENVKKEVLQKALALGQYINESQGEGLKYVVFCSTIENAQYIYEVLNSHLDGSVELYDPHSSIQFDNDNEIKVLILDERGEDGLNLNGGKKIVIHFDLPISIHRYEQRMGRVNRYSSHVYAAPVKSALIASSLTVVSNKWLEFLDEGVGIFHRSVAALQYLLERDLTKLWLDYVNNGLRVFDDYKSHYIGSNDSKGFIEKELTRVRVQEELNSQDIEISAAKKFAEDLSLDDSKSEEAVNEMMPWILQALQFRRISTPGEETFRLSYRTGVDGPPRTLVDVDSLIRHCLSVFPLDQADPLSPVSELMSASREEASRGKEIHPLRYGSSLLDSLYKYMKHDPRGVATAFIRQIKTKMPVDKVYLGVNTLASLERESDSYSDIVKKTEIFPPKVIKTWIKWNQAEVEEDEKIINVLEWAYNKRSDKPYTDTNIRSEMWSIQELDSDYPERVWTEKIDSLSTQIREQLRAKVLKENPNISSQLLNLEDVGYSFVVLTGI